jgi:hypothetical protein
MTPLQLAQFVHPYFVASDAEDLADAFEEGKQRAIRVLEKQISMVRIMTLDDYRRELCPQEIA